MQRGSLLLPVLLTLTQKYSVTMWGFLNLVSFRKPHIVTLYFCVRVIASVYVSVTVSVTDTAELMQQWSLLHKYRMWRCGLFEAYWLNTVCHSCNNAAVIIASVWAVNYNTSTGCDDVGYLKLGNYLNTGCHSWTNTAGINISICKGVVMPTNIFITLIKLAQAGLTRPCINLDIFNWWH